RAELRGDAVRRDGSRGEADQALLERAVHGRELAAVEDVLAVGRRGDVPRGLGGTGEGAGGQAREEVEQGRAGLARVVRVAVRVGRRGARRVLGERGAAVVTPRLGLREAARAEVAAVVGVGRDVEHVADGGDVVRV